MLIITCKIFSMLFAQRIFLLFNSPLPGGIFAFCMIFMLLDIITNNYGYKNARKIILLTLSCETIFALLVFTGLIIIPSSMFKLETSYILIFTSYYDIFIASFIATIIAFTLNCYVFSKLYYSFNGKHLWLRCILSTALGELVFSIIWTFIFFKNKLSFDLINHIVLNQYLFKVLFEVATLPITYLIIYLLDKFELRTDIEYKGFTPLYKTIKKQ